MFPLFRLGILRNCLMPPSSSRWVLPEHVTAKFLPHAILSDP